MLVNASAKLDRSAAAGSELQKASFPASGKFTDGSLCRHTPGAKRAPVSRFHEPFAIAWWKEMALVNCGMRVNRKFTPNCQVCLPLISERSLVKLLVMAARPLVDVRELKGSRNRKVTRSESQRPACATAKRVY